MNFLDHYVIPNFYFPVEIGNARCVESDGLFDLYVNDERWMVYDSHSKKEIYETLVEIETAYGDCVTTGLGFGLKELALCQKENVRSIRVFEISKSVIEIFYTFADKAKVDISKIEIINEDANDIKNIVSDCLLLDHFENETEDNQLEKIRKISNDNNYNFLYYWPATINFVNHVNIHHLEINKDNFTTWALSKNIKNFPPDLDDEIFLKMKIYQKKLIEINKQYKEKKNDSMG